MKKTLIIILAIILISIISVCYPIFYSNEANLVADNQSYEDVDISDNIIDDNDNNIIDLDKDTKKENTLIDKFKEESEEEILRKEEEARKKEAKRKEEEAKRLTELNKMKEFYKNSARINFLILGVEDQPRTDSMIFASYDTSNNKIYMISIPRDTYYHVKSHNSGDHRKINAAYARGREKGALSAVSNLLYGVPIHHYITLKYTGVESIVDAIGGVEVSVPTDIGSISKGSQILNGKQSIEFLRYRKGYSNGDLGRVSAQQQFIKAALKKSLSLKLPKVIKETYNTIKTDMSIAEVLKYALKSTKINPDDITLTTLPGTARYTKVGGYYWSYFYSNRGKTKEILYTLYNIK